MNAYSPAALAALATIGCSAYATASAGAEAGVLDRPALSSPRATHAVLMSVMRAGTHLAAVGERGIVLLSYDNGRSWKQSLAPVSVTLTGIHFTSAQEGWAVGHSGVVLHTQDGGQSWSRRLDGRQLARMFPVEKTDSERPAEPLFDIYFPGPRYGFAVGAYGLFLVSKDGGRTWVPRADMLPNVNGRHLYSVRALGSTMYIAGEAGLLYRSTDTGRSFTELRSPYPVSHFGVIPLPDDNVIVHGMQGNAFRSRDVGRNWEHVDTGTRAGLTSGIALEDGSVLLASQAGEILRLPPQSVRKQPLSLARTFPFSGLAQLSDGSVTCAVGTWAFSPIKFQADMGILLAFMFAWNLVGAMLLVPALAAVLLRSSEQGLKVIAGSRDAGTGACRSQAEIDRRFCK